LHVSPDAWEINLAWNDNSTNETAFVVQRSTNGTTFAQIAVVPSPQASMSDSAIAPATHYWYRVAATNNAGLSPWSNVAEVTTPSENGGALPPPWQDRDIGFTQGTATYSNGVFRVVGGGEDIYGTSDEFNFAFQPASGDASITTAIDGLDTISSINPWARIGLMIRETLDANSKNAMVFLSYQHGTGFTARQSTGGTTQYVPGPASARFLRLTRTGNTFSAYTSADGQSWQFMTSTTVTMGASAYIGLAVTSHNNAGEIAGRFSQVTATP